MSTVDYNNLIKQNINESLENNIILFRNIVTSLFIDENYNSIKNHVIRSYDYNSNTDTFDGSKNEIFLDDELFSSYYNSFFRDINNYENLNNIYSSIDLLKNNLLNYKNYLLKSVLNNTNKDL